MLEHMKKEIVFCFTLFYLLWLLVVPSYAIPNPLMNTNEGKAGEEQHRIL
jgi:hypothetical protein